MPRETWREVLRMLEEAEGYVSGSEMAQRLGVTRAAISKAVSALRRRGFIVESHPKLGYRLIACDDLASAQAYLGSLGTRLRFTVYYVREVGSTQDIAKGLAEQGAPEGTLVIAEAMTAGRGRMGRRWYAGPGGLWMTLLLRPPLPPSSIQVFSLAAGVAVSAAVEDVCGVRAQIKWPNDVLVGGRKLAGVLLEAGVEADILRYLLVGIGVNVNNELPGALRSIAVTLREVLGRPVPRVRLLGVLLARLDSLYASVIAGRWGDVLTEWKKRAVTLGRRVRVIYMDSAVEGLAEDVLSDGSLVVRLDNGEKKVVRAGDVVHLR